MQTEKQAVPKKVRFQFLCFVPMYTTDGPISKPLFLANSVCYPNHRPAKQLVQKRTMGSLVAGRATAAQAESGGNRQAWRRRGDGAAPHRGIRWQAVPGMVELPDFADSSVNRKSWRSRRIVGAHSQTADENV
jgi:hypothetical protein